MKKRISIFFLVIFMFVINIIPAFAFNFDYTQYDNSSAYKSIYYYVYDYVVNENSDIQETPFLASCKSSYNSGKTYFIIMYSEAKDEFAATFSSSPLVYNSSTGLDNSINSSYQSVVIHTLPTIAGSQVVIDDTNYAVSSVGSSISWGNSSYTYCGSNYNIVYDDDNSTVFFSGVGLPITLPATALVPTLMANVPLLLPLGIVILAIMLIVSITVILLRRFSKS